jgi:exosome complex component MTR3
MKKVYFQTGLTGGAKGSSYFELGNSKVICSVLGPHEITKKSEFSINGQISCKFEYASFSHKGQSQDRSNKEAEISDLIKTALESVVCLEMFPKAILDINFLVLEEDGGVISAALNAAGLALADASIPMWDLITSSCASLVHNEIKIFPSQSDEYCPSSDGLDMEGNVVLAYLIASNQIIFYHTDGVLSKESLVDANKKLIDTCKGMQAQFKSHLLKSFCEKNKN